MFGRGGRKEERADTWSVQVLTYMSPAVTQKQKHNSQVGKLNHKVYWASCQLVVKNSSPSIQAAFKLDFAVSLLSL